MTEKAGSYAQMTEIDLGLDPGTTVGQDVNDQCFVEPPASPLPERQIQQLGIQQPTSTSSVEMANMQADKTITVADSESASLKAAPIQNVGTAVTLFILNAVKNIMGTSLLVLPWCYAQMGYAVLPPTMIVVGVFATFSFITLGRLRDRTNAATYSDIFKIAYGPKMALFVDVTIAISAFVIVCCYTIVIGSNLPTAIAAWANVEPDQIFGVVSFTKQWLPGVWFTAIFILLPFSCLENLNSIRHASLVGIAGLLWIMLGAFILLGTTAAGGLDSAGTECYRAVHAGPNTDSPLLIFAAVPILGGICDAHMNAPRFAYEFQPIAKASKRWTFQVVSIVIMSIVILASLIFGLVGYVHLGFSVRDNVLKSYVASAGGLTGGVVSSMWFMAVISVTISFVLFFNALRASVVKLLFKEDSALAERFPDTPARRYVLTTILVFLSALVGSFVGQLGQFQGCMWGITGSLIVYIFPMLAARKLDLFEKKWEQNLAKVILLFGFFVSMCLGTPMAALSWAGAIPVVLCPVAA